MSWFWDTLTFFSLNSLLLMSYCQLLNWYLFIHVFTLTLPEVPILLFPDTGNMSFTFWNDSSKEISCSEIDGSFSNSFQTIKQIARSTFHFIETKSLRHDPLKSIYTLNWSLFSLYYVIYWGSHWASSLKSLLKFILNMHSIYKQSIITSKINKEVRDTNISLYTPVSPSSQNIY